MTSFNFARRGAVLPLLLLGSLLMLNACSQDNTPQVDGLRVGPWRAVLQVPGGELPFGMSVAAKDGKPVVTLVNGPNRVEVTEITVQDDEATMLMPGFENRLVARVDGGRMQGTLTMVKAGGVLQKIPFTATHGETWRFSPPPTAGASTDAASAGSSKPIEGRWAVTFGAGEKASAGVGEFTQQGNAVAGTIMTPTGDHRYLDGEFRDGELRLSKFDGGHVFLYRGRQQPDGSIVGKFWSGTASEDSFVARRDDAASLGDAENATKLSGKSDRLDFRFPDLAGHPISINDPFFHGKVVVVALAGSWCPNCHDEAAFLADFHRQRRAAGFEVISLMFEQFGDFRRAADATERFRRRYGIEYTTLIAGTSDKEDAASKLPQLNGVFAFPTTIFIDRQGKVRKIHTGFSGPATGTHYATLVADFTRTVDELLAEAPPPPLPLPVG
ncbi:MAG: TlpA family protein disulfide reductase [Gammaproteobacteria bacterium]|nr:TlpA family protein disulfide reductase [Gammaproteobacteria bacterium]